MLLLADITKNLCVLIAISLQHTAKIPQTVLFKNRTSSMSSVPVTTFPCLPWAELEVGPALSPRGDVGN